ncbi:OmpH family outer membrane protein [Ferruginibacter sp. SUN106]|uniref:OmpH family outer membrane protein n=1 Tax=Ferruginibacter sp. SUN106 TaxID=2978348 RepID=UPI003D35FAEB
MNKLSIAINLVLLAAVGYLYYNNFSVKKGGDKIAAENKITKDSCTTQHRIAYVELDSLNEHLVYLKQNRKSLEADQKVVEAKIAADYKALEAKQENFKQKNPNPRPEDIQNLQAQLMQEQQNIEAERQKQSQIFNQRSFSLMEKIQKDLKAFLSEYNKEKKFQYIFTTGGGMDYLIYKDSTLDITKDVIIGMNERLKPDTNK